jgi:hypothetical protein
MKKSSLFYSSSDSCKSTKGTVVSDDNQINTCLILGIKLQRKSMIPIYKMTEDAVFIGTDTGELGNPPFKHLLNLILIKEGLEFYSIRTSYLF